MKREFIPISFHFTQPPLNTVAYLLNLHDLMTRANSDRLLIERGGEHFIVKWIV